MSPTAPAPIARCHAACGVVVLRRSTRLPATTRAAARPLTRRAAWHRIARRRRGIMLLEIVVSLVLVGLFLLLFLPLWNATWRVQKEAAEATEAIFRAEAAAARLRTDAWSAGDAELAADGSLILGADATVRWSVEPAAEDAFRLPTATAPSGVPGFAVAPGRVTLSLGGRRIVCPAPLTESPR